MIIPKRVSDVNVSPEGIAPPNNPLGRGCQPACQNVPMGRIELPTFPLGRDCSIR